MFLREFIGRRKFSAVLRTGFEGEFDSRVNLVGSERVRRFYLCPFCAPAFFLRRRSCCLGGLTMSDEGGIDELPEFLRRVVTRAASSATRVSSSAIRLSLPPMMQHDNLCRQGRKNKLKIEGRNTENGYKTVTISAVRLLRRGFTAKDTQDFASLTLGRNYSQPFSSSSSHSSSSQFQSQSSSSSVSFSQPQSSFSQSHSPSPSVATSSVDSPSVSIGIGIVIGVGVSGACSVSRSCCLCNSICRSASMAPS